MLFIDVSSSCKSAKNTGMQRTTRGLYRHLARQLPVTPVCWNRMAECYQRLGSREMQILTEPFRVRSKATARPEWYGETRTAEVMRLFFRQTIDLARELTREDVLLIPDFYRDARADLIPEVIRATGVYSVAIFHDAAALRWSGLSAIDRKRFHKYLKSLAACDLVICISEDSQEDLLRIWREDGVAPTRTTVESWPVEFDRDLRGDVGKLDRNIRSSLAAASVGSDGIASGSGAASSGGGVDEDGAEASRRGADVAHADRVPIVACIASFEPRKNHLTLLGAAEQSWSRGMNFQLQLVGRTTHYSARRVIPLVWRLRARGRPVSWLRHISDAALHDVLRSCRFTVYPSLMEGFGLPIAESLWHGKPVVCGGNGALGELARDGGCLIVDQTSEDSLAAGIEKLLTDRNTYDRLCSEARARTFRSWSDYMHNLLGHLQRNVTATA
jgi:glycosyltransferase involved in cell wall biosynthesis